MEIAEEKYPRVYEVLHDMAESTQSHIKAMDNEQAGKFYTAVKRIVL